MPAFTESVSEHQRELNLYGARSFTRATHSDGIGDLTRAQNRFTAQDAAGITVPTTDSKQFRSKVLLTAREDAQVGGNANSRNKNTIADRISPRFQRLPVEAPRHALKATTPIR